MSNCESPKIVRKAILDTEYSTTPKSGAFVSPLIDKTLGKRSSRKTKANAENIVPRPLKFSFLDHEAVIAELLSKAFKVPIADYIPEYSNKTLGIRKILVRRYVWKLKCLIPINLCLKISSTDLFTIQRFAMH